MSKNFLSLTKSYVTRNATHFTSNSTKCAKVRWKSPQCHPSLRRSAVRVRTASIHPSDTPTSSTTTLTIQNRMQPERAGGRARAPVLCVILLLCRTISKENGDQETNQRPMERGEEGDHLTFLNAFT